MGAKINGNASMHAVYALQEYKREYSSLGEMHVIAKRSNEIIFNKKVKVIVGDFNIDYKVSIMWEDVEANFHDIGLYGYYSTNYCRMDYPNGVLTIHDGNGIEITITQ